MIFMDVGTEKYKRTFADFIKKYRIILIAILVIVLYIFIKDIVTQRDIMVYDTNLEYLYTVDTNKGKTIRYAPNVDVPDGYVIVWYDNPQFEGFRVGFPYPVEEDGGLYPKLVGNFYRLTYEPNNGDHTSYFVTRYNAIVEEPEPPVRDGYIFAGWYEEDSSTVFVFDRMPLYGARLYARWIRVIDNG